MQYKHYAIFDIVLIFTQFNESRTLRKMHNLCSHLNGRKNAI